jgi:glycosyltransferase involved in cell wall biosynthesis
VPFARIAGLLGPDLAVYTGDAPASVEGGDAGAEPPLISCIMPTHERRAFASQAIRYFLRQDYPRKELIVVDDGEDAIDDVIPRDARVHYVRVPRRTSLGAKRNIAVRESRGSIIAHWDDDDWYHPAYLASAAAPLVRAADPSAISGDGTYFVWIAGEAVVRLCRSSGIAGATFVYFKRLWEQHPYRDVDRAEDFFLLQDARPAVIRRDQPGRFVVIRHGSHTWRTDGDRDVTEQLRRLPACRPLRDVTGADDASFYRESLAQAVAPALVRGDAHDDCAR